jgi:Common central domain of tyrosinase/Polyphenol oxidase middle domain
MRPTIIFYIALFVFGATCHNAVAQSPQFVPAYPLYCQGPLTTGAPSGGETSTPFQWASVGAGAANPSPGQCVWADRGPRGTEIQSGDGNAICDWSSAMQSVPAGTFVEVGVARDPIVGNCMHLFRYIGTVSPPFSGVPFLQPFTRQSIASLTAVQITALQAGLQVMMSRPVTDPTSYRFQANIHGTEDTATTPEEMQSWDQCEHGSFYFPPWHRMYLYFFDRILRAAAASAGYQNVVLPYWDWTDPAQRALPLPFRQPANASNSLYIAPPGRPSGVDSGAFSLSSGAVDDSAALADVDFDTGGSLGNGFGSGAASPAQFNGATGDLEMQPHNVVHSDLGGLMSVIDTAAQDPIFWLHHANIDRLWNKWIQEGGGRADPTDPAWLNTTFTFYDEAGHAVYLTGSEVVDTVGQLNYRYDDDPPPPMFRRFPIILAESGAVRGEQRITLGASPVTVRLPVDEQMRKALTTLSREPDRKLFLRIQDIRTEKPPSYHYAIYLNPPTDRQLDERTPGFVGNLSLFSMTPHKMPNGMPMPRQEMSVNYNVSRVAAELPQDSKELSIVLIPRGLVGPNGEPAPLPEESAATAGSLQLIER